jgi:hypothetical protein
VSITTGPDGFGLISYQTPSGVKVAHCLNATCSSSNINLVNGSGSASSITIGSDGLGLVSVYAPSGGDLYVMHCNNADCSAPSAATPDTGGDVGNYNSITIGPDGLGLVVYYDTTNGNLKLVHCANTSCSSSTVQTIDASANDVGYYPSLTVGVDGLPVVSYFDNTSQDLDVMHLSNLFGVPYFRRR